MIDKTTITEKLITFGIILGIIYLFYYNIYKFDFNSINIMHNDDENDKSVVFKDIKVKLKYDKLLEHMGPPNKIEKNSDLFVESITWQLPLNSNNFKLGYFNGLDMIKLNGYVARKHHPIPADVYVIVGKYINVPDKLVGYLKYASPTINIEHIYVPKKYNSKYEKTGKKTYSLVTGSCASITISTITLKFVEDMIREYEDKNLGEDEYKKFRDEYDKRVLDHLCGKGIQPNIYWFNPENFGEKDLINIGHEKCVKTKKSTSSELDKLLDNINEKTKDIVNEDELKKTFKVGNKTSGGGKKIICSNAKFSNKCDEKHCYWDEGECKKKKCSNAKTKNDCDIGEYALKCYWDSQENKCEHKPA